MEERKLQVNIHSIIKFLQGIAFTMLIFAVILAIYLLTVYHTRLAPFVSYAIVFDAGSSHTEMFVYHWPADKSDGLGTTSTVNELFVCPLQAVNVSDPTKEGELIKLKAISDFEQNLDQLEDYFRPCLNEAILKIPVNRHRLSPVFLGATAGMRLSRLRNVTRANQVLESIREIFSNSPFQFVVARQVRILTGMEEAIDGWITTNLLLEKFKHRHANKKPLAEQELDTDMVGVLDLGGASTQVTFTYEQTRADEPVPDEFTNSITLFDRIYRPYAHSYLCWGKNEALKRHRARLVNSAIHFNRTTFSSTSKTLIRDPCLPRGTNDTLTISSIFRSPCTADERQKLNPNFNRSGVIIMGAGNSTECSRRLTEMFNATRNDKSTNCSYKQDYCAIDNTFRPKLPNKIRFIGLSGYYYVFRNLAYRMRHSSEWPSERYKYTDFSQEQIDQRLVDVCETDHAKLYKQEDMAPATENFKRMMCFDAWYMRLLLKHAVGFEENDLKRLSFANTFPTGKVGWTLGYMINQTNYIPAEYRERIITKSSFVGWLVSSLTIVVLTLIFLLLTSYMFCRPRPGSPSDRHSSIFRTSEDQVA